MSTSTPFQAVPREPVVQPFPARGVAGGWRDPWGGDPVETMVAALRQQRARRRCLSEAAVDRSDHQRERIKADMQGIGSADDLRVSRLSLIGADGKEHYDPRETLPRSAQRDR
jgi:hypothetical protein